MTEYEFNRILKNIYEADTIDGLRGAMVSLLHAIRDEHADLSAEIDMIKFGD